jgi:hypothetical protein
MSSGNTSTVIKSKKNKKAGTYRTNGGNELQKFQGNIIILDFQMEDMGLKEMKCDGADWIQLTEQRPVAGSCEHDDVHSGSMRSQEYRDE